MGHSRLPISALIVGHPLGGLEILLFSFRRTKIQPLDKRTRGHPDLLHRQIVGLGRFFLAGPDEPASRTDGSGG